MGGNVGIGTTTPQWLLNPTSATASQLALSAGAEVGQWAFRNAGGNLYLATTTVAGTATSSLSALTITGSNGNFGIGTSSPYTDFSIQNGTATTTISFGAVNTASCLQWFLPDGAPYREYLSNGGSLGARGTKIIEAGTCE